MSPNKSMEVWDNSTNSIAHYSCKYTVKLCGVHQSFKMSRSHGRATAQNFAEFAQNLEMCTPKLEKSCIFTILTCFYQFYVICFCWSWAHDIRSAAWTSYESPLINHCLAPDCQHGRSYHSSVSSFELFDGLVRGYRASMHFMSLLHPSLRRNLHDLS